MTYAEAYQAASIATARQVESLQVCNILNLAQELIWREFPWRWTLGELNPFWLTALEMDYGAPMVVIPTDFLELHSANTVWLNNNLATRRQMTCMKGIQKQTVTGVPNSISYVPEKACFRVSPRPSSGVTAPYMLVEGVYKKTPTILTPDNYQTTDLPSQEFQRHMWLLAITWAYYETIKDQKAPIYHDRARQAINETARAEATSLGEPRVHPTEPLISGNGYGNFGPGIALW